MNGTYVGVTYDGLTCHVLDEWMRLVGIPNRVNADSLHTTLIYSRVAIDPKYHLALGRSDLQMLGWRFEPSGFDVFDDKCLVMLINARGLVEFHQQLLACGGTHDFKPYNPHVTLSYDVTGFDHTKLSLPEIVLTPVSVYTEPLELDWKPNER